MADNVVSDLGSGGATWAAPQLTFSGDTANVPIGSGGILTGSEGAWTYTLIVGGAGAVTAGTQRVTLASDDPGVTALQVIDDWDESDRAKVNLIVGQAGIAAGAGAVGVTVPRMTLASDDPAVSALGATGDAAATQGSTGSISAKLRTVTSQLNTISSGIPVTNAGTFAVQATVAAGATNIAKAEDVASADADVGVPALAVRKATPANTSGTDGDYEFLQMSAGRLWVSAAVDTALPAGTNAIGKLASNTGVTIGAVEIAAAQTLATVTTVSTVTTCSTVTTLTGGGVAHDSADSGNPVKVGGRAVSSLATATMVAAADRSDLVTDIDGALIVRLNRPAGDSLSERVTNTDGASTAFSTFGAVASTRNVVTSIAIFNSSASAGYVDFRDGTTGGVLWTMPIPAGGGSVLSHSNALFRTSANTALAFDVSAALSTVYISVSGFQSKV